MIFASGLIYDKKCKKEDLSAYGGTCRSETKIPIHRGPQALIFMWDSVPRPASFSCTPKKTKQKKGARTYFRAVRSVSLR